MNGIAGKDYGMGLWNTGNEQKKKNSEQDVANLSFS